MSRELEFRAWQNGNKEMVYFRNEKMKHDIYQKRHFCNLLSDGKLEQYTGLKDKNGVKIFEGDVLEMIGSNGYSPYSEPYCGESRSWLNQKFIVVYNSGFFHGRHVKGFKIGEVYAHNQVLFGWQILKPYDLWNCSPWTKVIGNIHENPELLS